MDLRATAGRGVKSKRRARGGSARDERGPLVSRSALSSAGWMHVDGATFGCQRVVSTLTKATDNIRISCGPPPKPGKPVLEPDSQI